MSELSNLVDKVKDAVVCGAQDIAAFAAGAATYAALNIKPEMWKIAADAYKGAADAFATDNTVDKYTHALAAAGKAALADGIEFIEADFNYAIETMHKAHAAHKASVQALSDQSEASGTSTDNTGSAA